MLSAGICMRRRDAFDRDALHFAPFLLLPSPFPRRDFETSVELQPVLNELMHKGQFLQREFAPK
jgi:glutathione synthase